MHPQPIEHTPMTGGEIAAARAAYGLTSADLARVLGVNERTARRWEAGTTRPTGAVAAEIRAIDARIDRLADHLAQRAVHTRRRRKLLSAVAPFDRLMPLGARQLRRDERQTAVVGDVIQHESQRIQIRLDAVFL